MELLELNATQFQDMIVSGSEYLTENVDLVNSLNVFPVPDGDTGTNMNMTFISGRDYLLKEEGDHVGEAALNLAKGLLMGARGNSGVILSQIFRGFSQAIKEEKHLDAKTFVAAFAGGVESAYKAVMKPVEGTILTVAREAAIAGEKQLKESSDIIEIMRAIVDGATLALESTPDLLPVLKQVGVVDSGGKGLLCIYEGFLANLTGEKVISKNKAVKDESHAHAIFSEMNEEMPLRMEDITFGFCTEIMVRLDQNKNNFDEQDFRQTLNQMGDSLLVVADDEIVKVHVHTENPGKVMQLGQEFGELIKIKVDNMREQVRELERQDQQIQPHSQKTDKKYAIVTVAAGKGMIELFKSMGVDYVLAGGQTMNPSTEDFVKAIDQLYAEEIIILPNNKNIIMAAEQVSQVSDKSIHVIPTKTIPQGIAALISFNPEMDVESNLEHMSEMSQSIKSGQITYSIRDTEIDGVNIKKDDFMGIIDNKIKFSHPELETCLLETLLQMVNDHSELATVLVGEDGDLGLAEATADQVNQVFADVEFEIIKTDQPVYHYIMSVE